MKQNTLEILDRQLSDRVNKRGIQKRSKKHFEINIAVGFRLTSDWTIYFLHLPIKLTRSVKITLVGVQSAKIHLTWWMDAGIDLPIVLWEILTITLHAIHFRFAKRFF